MTQVPLEAICSSECRGEWRYSIQARRWRTGHLIVVQDPYLSSKRAHPRTLSSMSDQTCHALHYRAHVHGGIPKPQRASRSLQTDMTISRGPFRDATVSVKPGYLIICIETDIDLEPIHVDHDLGAL